MKKFVSLLMVALITLVLAACGESEVQEVENDSTESESADASTEDGSSSEGDEAQASGGEEQQKSNEGTNESEKEEKVYGIGDTVSIDGMEVTIDSTSWGEQGEFTPAENGNVLRLEVSFHNASADSGFVDNTEFSVYDADGNAVNEYFGSPDTNTNMFSHDLKQGKKASGVLEYDVPESDFYEVYYEPTFTMKENAEIMWKIKSSDIQ
ncbi:DUF4352 domain-containing protein [Lentibacillus sp.]|uniref:DUF4352 domain-containing protein n=1 Tax=Lentibacillus sp. TaxID=1925746 RepID=UPI002B4AE1C2|nr:DUF4352 domain-containing protein [Lentibacillus sp.]HLS09871.1 DUF4352 domain-containing protein [Lentibacillus sp.]